MVMNYFDHVEIAGRPLGDYLTGAAEASDLYTLKSICEIIQIRSGLLLPYGPGYPMINPRELSPPFDPSLLEYESLPGFSMLALDRRLDYINEIFQFDLLDDPDGDDGAELTRRRAYRSFLERLPKIHHADLEYALAGRDITDLGGYPAALTALFNMDRAHVIARSRRDRFRLLGVYASFPSDLNREIKSFGFRIGKFKPNDSARYQHNRPFVYRYLMELLGFPIASERRTSAALFCRRLAGLNEHCFVSVLGNSDRVLTFLSSRGRGRWPLVEKIALVKISPRDMDVVAQSIDESWFVDPEQRVIILKVIYTQHDYNANNVMEDRALSVADQNIIHPRTGKRSEGIDLLHLQRSRVIRLNDIVRGEYDGEIVLDGHETIHGTEDHLSRLLFIKAWLAKHRRVILGYAPANFEKICRPLESYLQDDASDRVFTRHAVAYHKVRIMLKTLRQEYDLLSVKRALFRDDDQLRRMPIKTRFTILAQFLARTKDLLDYEQEVFDKAMVVCDRILEDPYFTTRYLDPNKQRHTDYESTVLELYAQLVFQRTRLEDRYHAAAHATSAV